MIGRFLLIFFVIIPMIELFILVQVGKAIGFWNTVSILLILGILGLAMIRRQGFSVVGRIRQDLASGIAPGHSLLDGLMVLLGGIFLIIPGLVTDIVGMLLLIPPLRKRIVSIITPLLVNHLIRNTKVYIKRY